MSGYREGTIAAYVAAAAEGKPTPGGGSVSAMVGALGTTMGSMAGNFTAGREKYAAVEGEARRILGELERLRKKLLELVDRDVEAYGVVDRAMRMEKKSEEEKRARKEAVQQALGTAIEVPLETMRACAGALRELAKLVDIANPNLVSDVGVGAIATEAGLRSAKLNVEVNLAALRDEELVKRIRAESDALGCEGAALVEEVVEKVERGMRGHG